MTARLCNKYYDLVYRFIRSYHFGEAGSHLHHMIVSKTDQTRLASRDTAMLQSVKQTNSPCKHARIQREREGAGDPDPSPEKSPYRVS